jgi:GDP-L-fucose synthase
MRRYSDEQIINIGSGTDLDIKSLADLVQQTIGFEGRIVWDKSKPDGTPRKWMDSSRIFGLGWKPDIDLGTGIRLAYEDYVKRGPGK